MEKKTLSQKIGGHMKAGEQDEAAALKVEVAKLNEVAGASNPAPAPEHNHEPEPEPEPKPNAEPKPNPAPEQVADASDAKVDELEAQRASLFNSLPNLLDPRTPEGDDEDSNVEVSKRAGRHRLLTSHPAPDLKPDPHPDPEPGLHASYTRARNAAHGPAAPHATAPRPHTHLRTRLRPGPRPQVSSWGCEGELPTGRLWHDDVGTSLGGIDMERHRHSPRPEPTLASDPEPQPQPQPQTQPGPEPEPEPGPEPEPEPGPEA